MTVKVSSTADALNLPCFDPWDNMYVETQAAEGGFLRKYHSL